VEAEKDRESRGKIEGVGERSRVSGQRRRKIESVGVSRRDFSWVLLKKKKKRGGVVGGIGKGEARSIGT